MVGLPGFILSLEIALVGVETLIAGNDFVFFFGGSSMLAWATSVCACVREVFDAARDTS